MSVNLDKQLTENFWLREFILSDFYTEKQQRKVINSVDTNILRNIHEVAENLQVLRSAINARIDVNIGFRPVWYELEKGRSGKSQHTKAKAADIKSPFKTSRELYDIVEELITECKMKQGGLGYYNTFIHYDIFFDGANVRRW